MGAERLAEDILTVSRMFRTRRYVDMTPQQYWLMRHLRRNGPQSIGEIANALGVTMGSATIACKRLEKAGLVTRERQVNDERIVHVILTEQGRAQIDAWREHKLESIEKLLDVFDEQEQQVFQQLVERLIATAEEQGFEA
jgi:DNA-binding MarR family transcriptional regulator